MTYQQTIDHLYTQLPMFSRIGAAAYKEDLDNTIALCKMLGNPQNKFRSIHIAGTNGKGSTSHMLAAIMQAAGYKTGLYTSPHLKDFGERIKINGEMINEDFVIDFVERTNQISTEIEPSFFELTVAMAFEYFAKEKVDIAIIETGLGGRLDSTNIITPVLSIITNIGYDHMNLLGDTLDKIAFEKAGIIKPTIPVVIGETLPETKPVFLQKAIVCNASIYFAEESFGILAIEPLISELKCTLLNNKDNTSTPYTLDLTGLYQLKNLRSIATAIPILQENGFNLPPEKIQYALANVKKLTGLHGRWEVIGENPLTIVDVAHNEDGVKQVLAQVDAYLNANNKTLKNVHFIWGMVNDKDITKILSMLPTNATYYFTQAHIPRALMATELQQKAAQYNLQGKKFDDVNEAIIAAQTQAKQGDIIIVFGSIFLVGEVKLPSARAAI